MALKLSDLLLRPVDKPDPNKLTDAYEVAADISTDYNNVTIRVPKLFQYDGASIPEIGWYSIGTPFTPRLMLASVFHDWIYHTHQIERSAADDLFHLLLRRSGVPKDKALAMKTAVDLFGGNYWKNDKDDIAYIKRLKDQIIQDGRNPADYGIP